MAGLPRFSNAFAFRWALRAEPEQASRLNGCIRSQNSKCCHILAGTALTKRPESVLANR
jgi:hypothetical protein